MLNGERNGNWIQRFANGTIAEGPFVDGEPHGDWVIRDADGDVEVWRFEHGERVDR